MHTEPCMQPTGVSMLSHSTVELCVGIDPGFSTEVAEKTEVEVTSVPDL